MRVRSAPIRHFVDTSIAIASLNLTPEQLAKDYDTLGLFFEDFAIRDLSIYATALGGEIYHYRDSSGAECDCVMTLDDGRWGLIEIKLGGSDAIKKGVSSLQQVAKKIDPKRHGKPSFMMILTACGPALKTKEGVHVVPINCLRA